MKIIAFSVLAFFMFGYFGIASAQEELSVEQRKAKLEECYSYCGEDNICIANCQQAFGDAQEDEEEEENCD